MHDFPSFKLEVDFTKQEIFVHYGEPCIIKHKLREGFSIDKDGETLRFRGSSVGCAASPNFSDVFETNDDQLPPGLTLLKLEAERAIMDATKCSRDLAIEFVRAATQKGWSFIQK